MNGPRENAVDLGHDTWYTKVEDSEGTWVGIHEWHREREGGDYESGFIQFAGRGKVQHSVAWDVISEDPLTLSPSLACRTCGHHGFIRNGRWEPC